MIINSQNIEFGYELISVIPYANYLASKGLLKKTISGNDTECLYYFSPDHEINPEPRSWHNTSKVNAPNIRIHKSELDKSQFLAPDFKKQYANNRFKFDKETVIICNRHNTEWNARPINYFNIPTLRKMFEMLQDKYQVIYINIESRKELYDNMPPEYLGDFDILPEYPNVINIHDLHANNTDLSFNTLQLMVFANCEKFITMNGGHAILASYFGGENIIMSKYGQPQARELSENVNSFYRWYNEFGDQRCIHVSDELKLLRKIQSLWIDKDPIVNILVRTSHRPNYFETCMKSIMHQDYQNINVFVSIDDKKKDYTVKYPVYPIHVKPISDIRPINDNENYGRILPYNLYLNELHNKCKSGLICYMDDDDKYSSNQAISNIVNAYKEGSEIIFWRAKVGSKIIPEDGNFGKEPILYQLSGIAFAFDAKYKDLAVWEPYKRGDYRVAAKLYPSIEKRAWINEILAETQEGSHFGSRIDKKNINRNNDENNLKRIYMKVKIIACKNKHGRVFSDKQLNTIVDLPEPMALQYIKGGLVTNKLEEKKSEVQKVSIPVKENKVIEPEKINKFINNLIGPQTSEPELEIKSKRGRKSKK